MWSGYVKPASILSLTDIVLSACACHRLCVGFHFKPANTFVLFVYSVYSVLFASFNCETEEVILAEERTTEEEKMHIMEGTYSWFTCMKWKLWFIIEHTNYFLSQLQHDDVLPPNEKSLKIWANQSQPTLKTRMLTKIAVKKVRKDIWFQFEQLVSLLFLHTIFIYFRLN